MSSLQETIDAIGYDPLRAALRESCEADMRSIIDRANRRGRIFRWRRGMLTADESARLGKLSREWSLYR